MEEWKAIPGYPGYEVSSNGRVRCWRKRNANARVPSEPRSVKPIPSKAHGYVYVSLSVDGRVKRERVHKLALLAFLGPVPREMECAHLDGNRANNNIVNLAYKTHAENMRDRESHGRVPYGTAVVGAKLNDEAARAIYTAEGQYAAIGADYGVDRAVVRLIKQGKAWTRATAPIRVGC